MTQPAAVKALTFDEIITRIRDRVERFGVDVDDLPAASVYAWWSPQYGKYQHFRLGEEHPWDKQLRVAFLFREDNAIRAYTVPGPDWKPKEGDQHPLKRWILSKENQSYEVETLTLEGFIQGVADEWMVVAEGMTTADAERDRIVDFLKTKGWGVAADAVEALEHLEGEDEEPEAPAPSPAPNGSPVPGPESVS
jgi:hypothetical protein